MACWGWGVWRLGRGLMFGKMGVDVLCVITSEMYGRGWKLVKVKCNGFYIVSLNLTA